MYILILFYQNFNVAFAKVIAHSIVVLYMIEKIRKIRDSKGVFAAVLTDLYKGFDCISHELLLAKLHAYGFDKISIRFYACLLESTTAIYPRATFIYNLYLRFVYSQLSP